MFATPYPPTAAGDEWPAQPPFVAHLEDPVILAKVEQRPPTRRLHLRVWSTKVVTEAQVRRLIKRLLLRYQAEWDPDNEVSPPSDWSWAFDAKMELPKCLRLENAEERWVGVLLTEPMVLFTLKGDEALFSASFAHSPAPQEAAVAKLRRECLGYVNEYVIRERVAASGGEA